MTKSESQKNKMPDIVTEIFLIGMFLAAFIEKFDGWGAGRKLRPVKFIATQAIFPNQRGNTFFECQKAMPVIQQ